MKTRMRYILVVVISLFFLTDGTANDLPELLQTVLKMDTSFQSISCKIDISLDVPGVNMPEKEVELTLQQGRRPQIKGKGITILPRHGMMNQYREFLDTECQAILLREEGDTVVYKVVSLDHRSDWVTVDLTLTRSDARVYSMLITTRKSGEYFVRHRYGPAHEMFPEQTVVSFESMPLKLPLKFLGNQEGMEFLSDSSEPVSGRIILNYSDISWKKSTDL